MQGFNMGRYYPPDADSTPTFNTTHPLGARASKIKQGVLTVRFELPFAVWCQHCKPEAIVGQGVRFNAEKKKVGNYYTTPIWSFRMKHSACGGWWEIRTDPKNAEYVVAEGARKRDYGPDDVKPSERGDLMFLTEEERARRRDDAFANLEGKMEEKGEMRKNKVRVEELYEANDVWEDPYTANQNLRKTFRVRRKVLEKEDEYKEGLQDKFSFGFEIANETETDRLRAKLVEFGEREADGVKNNQLMWKPLFDSVGAEKAVVETPKKKLKAEIAAEKSRKDLQRSLVGNTKAAIDPFVKDTTRIPPKVNLGLLKRKRDEDGKSSITISTASATNDTLSTAVEQADSKSKMLAGALVGYDSD
jgi:coiled-coil domain-containing protein 130